MKFNINILGIESLKQKLDKLDKINTSKSFRKRILSRLATIGIDKAQVLFHEAEYDGENDVELLDPQWIDDNTVRIVAQGNAVTFIEFGAGVYYNSTNKHPKAEEMGAKIGEYGQGRGKHDFWFYKGEGGEEARDPKMAARGLKFTRGNKPAMAMYEASKLIRSKIIEIIREEIHK